MYFKSLETLASGSLADLAALERIDGALTRVLVGEGREVAGLARECAVSELMAENALTLLAQDGEFEVVDEQNCAECDAYSPAGAACRDCGGPLDPMATRTVYERTDKPAPPRPTHPAHLPPADLVAAVQAGRVFVVLGTGATIAVTRKHSLGWEAVLDRMISHAASEATVGGDEWSRKTRAKLGVATVEAYLDVAEDAQAFMENAAPGSFGRWLRIEFGRLAAVHTSVYDELERLPVLVGTTNYDTTAARHLKRTAVAIDEADHALEVIRDKAWWGHSVLHMHGVWSYPDTIVLGEQSYATRRTAGAQQALQAQLELSCTWLFVGCGAGAADPNIGALLERHASYFGASGVRHYFLARGPEVEQMRTLLQAMPSIQVVSYGDKHEDLAPFLALLRP